jgi:putative membrane protein
MPPRLKSFLQAWLIGTLAVLVAAELVKGIDYETWQSLLAATLLLGILNTFVRPLLTLLSLPLMIVTLGLFRLIINAVLLLLVNRLIPRFHVDSFGSAFWGALIISIVSLVLNTLTGTGETRIEIRRVKRDH